MLGKEFEKLVWDRFKQLNALGLMDAGKYGVQVSVIGKDKLIALQSLPDFEGLLPGRTQFITDTKVCSQASFALNKYVSVLNEKKGPRERQLRHMRNRARMGACCFFLIHWNERVLQKETIPECTYAFPVLDNDFWREVDYFERKKITLADCEELGVRVGWNTLDKDRTARPDVLSAINTMLERFGHG